MAIHPRPVKVRRKAQLAQPGTIHGSDRVARLTRQANASNRGDPPSDHAGTRVSAWTTPADSRPTPHGPPFVDQGRTILERAADGAVRALSTHSSLPPSIPERSSTLVTFTAVLTTRFPRRRRTSARMRDDRLWAREGAIPAAKLGNRGGFGCGREDLDRFLEARRAEGTHLGQLRVRRLLGPVPVIARSPAGQTAARR